MTKSQRRWTGVCPGRFLRWTLIRFAVCSRRFPGCAGPRFGGVGQTGSTTAELPVFGGPSGSEREVAKAFAQYRELLAPIGLEPREVVLSARYAWHLKLSNGLSVQLGRDSDKELASNRLSRFVEVYPRTLARLSRRLDYVDLRYPNGFALRVPGVDREDAGKGTRKKV